MYIPKYFKVEDKEKIFNFLDENSFGILISNHEGIPVATHMPLILDRKSGCMYGHFAKQNTQWNGIWNQEVLVVFQGPHSYISSSWYETNVSVPTWNYVAVHVYGSLEQLTNKEEIVTTLKAMIEKYEVPDRSYQMDGPRRCGIEHL